MRFSMSVSIERHLYSVPIGILDTTAAVLIQIISFLNAIVAVIRDLVGCEADTDTSQNIILSSVDTRYVSIEPHAPLGDKGKKHLDTLLSSVI